MREQIAADTAAFPVSAGINRALTDESGLLIRIPRKRGDQPTERLLWLRFLWHSP